MLVIYAPEKEMTLNKITITSDSENHSLNSNSFSVIFNFENETLSKKISFEQLRKIVCALGFDWRNLRKNPDTLLNVNLLHVPFQCTKYSSDNSTFYIENKGWNFYFHMYFGFDEFMNEMIFSLFVTFLKTFRQLQFIKV